MKQIETHAASVKAWSPATVLDRDGNPQAWLRLPEVLKPANCSKVAYYDWMSRGMAPQPDIRMGRKFVAWKAETIAEWLADPVAWAERNRAAQGAPAEEAAQ